MIDWGGVGAFIGPVVGAIAVAGGWFTYLDKKRKDFVQAAINTAITAIEARLSVVEHALESQSQHLSKQDDALNLTMQSVARIEGRLTQVLPPRRTADG